MDTQRPDEPVQTSMQKTPVSGGAVADRARKSAKRKKVLKKILLPAIILLVAAVGVGLYFLLTAENRPDDPSPDVATEELSLAETDQRLQARYGMSIEKVRASGVDMSRVNSFSDAVEIATILDMNELAESALELYGVAEEKANDSERTVGFYTDYMFVAYRANDTAKSDEVAKKAIEQLEKDSSIDDAEKTAQREWIEQKQATWRATLNENSGESQ